MSIEDWRSEIDEIDTELLGLLNRRASLAVRVGQSKRLTEVPSPAVSGIHDPPPIGRASCLIESATSPPSARPEVDWHVGERGGEEGAVEERG